jgi:hypothetical protein
MNIAAVVSPGKIEGLSTVVHGGGPVIGVQTTVAGHRPDPGGNCALGGGVAVNALPYGVPSTVIDWSMLDTT